MPVIRKPIAQPTTRTFYISAPQVRTPTAPTGKGTVPFNQGTTGLTPAQIAALSPASLAKIAGSGINNTPNPFGWIKDIVPYLKVTAGGIVVLVSGLALVYVAGRNAPGAKAAAGAVGAVATPTKAIARKAAPERTEARRIAKVTRSSERTTRARSRVVTEGNRTRVSSRKEGARAREQAAEYDSTKGQRQRENLAALRNRRPSPAIHSKERASA